ncbi:MAG: PIN domain-containing protein [Alphaproteobacteria bacterium]|nr:PIN domain-containing protein [Alphaproteobacteria bacterium]
MKVTVDTNVLLRVLIPDSREQQELAAELLKAADSVAISVHSLCELAWVMERSYDAPRTGIATAIRHLLSMRNVVLNRLALLEAGGDLADDRPSLTIPVRCCRLIGRRL